jgi:hypothetical protein
MKLAAARSTSEEGTKVYYSLSAFAGLSFGTAASATSHAEHSGVMSMLLVFFLHQGMRRLALRSDENENRDLESRTNIRVDGTTDDLAGSASSPPDLIL